MKNKLKDIIKSFDGNVLAIGIDDNLVELLNKKKSVNLYSINRFPSGGNLNHKSKKKAKRTTNKGKYINIKKLRKYITKKSSNYLICNMDEIIEYYKYFIRDSIYINNNMIYVYLSNDIDPEFIIDKYKRYNVAITKITLKEGIILEINNMNGKNNKIKDKLYFIKDTFYNIAETIGNILVS